MWSLPVNEQRLETVLIFGWVIEKILVGGEANEYKRKYVFKKSTFYVHIMMNIYQFFSSNFTALIFLVVNDAPFMNLTVLVENVFSMKFQEYLHSFKDHTRNLKNK